MHQRAERLGRQPGGGGARDGAALDLGFARLVDDGQAGRPLRRGHRRHEHQAPADQVDHAGQRRGRRRRGAVVKPARTRGGQPAVGLAARRASGRGRPTAERPPRRSRYALRSSDSVRTMTRSSRPRARQLEPIGDRRPSTAAGIEQTTKLIALRP